MLRKFAGVIAFAAVAGALLPAGALAAVNLKKVNIVDGNQIELLFDGKIESGQVKTEYVRDNIQLSLTNASVYPAKVSMVSGSDLTKVFAYQYSPALVRARFSVKGEAADYANRLQVRISGKTITLKIAPAAKADSVATASASALRAVAEKTADETDAKPEKKAEKKESSESKSLLDRVAEGASPLKAAEAASDDRSDKADRSEKGEKRKSLAGGDRARREPLAGGKPLPSPFRSIGMMLFVLGVFGLFVMFLKRVKGGQGKSAPGAKGLGGFLTKLSGGAAAKQMIEVVATHHLAPKRSIVVVRVQDRMLVLGMTNDAVNLITEFQANEDGDGDEKIPLGTFAASLAKFEKEELAPAPTAKVSPKANLGDIAAAALGLAKPKPASAPRANAAASAYRDAGTGPAMAPQSNAALSPALAEAMKQPSVKPNLRAQIKDRVQGMKQL